MSVRVGLGWSPFERIDPSSAGFWATVEVIEEQGYDSLWLSDTATLADVAPLPALAAVAARTSRLKLGTGVLVAPARNPVLLAKELATVDRISSGRLFPAMGLGLDEPRESAAIGIPREERAARTSECLAIVRALWAGGPVTHAGRFWSFEDVTLSPRPTRPRLDVWLAGSAPAALRRAGRLADGWLGSFLAAGEIGPMIDSVRAAAAEAGRAIEDDHYGTTLFAAPGADRIPPAALGLLGRRADLPMAEHVALGARALRRLLERFVAEGVSKFVVIPMADDLPAWLREIRLEAAGPAEELSPVPRPPAMPPSAADPGRAT